MHRSRLTFGAVAVLGVALALGPAGTVSAKSRHHHAPRVSDPIATGLIGPLQLDVSKRGLIVAQAFAGLVSKVNRDGTTDVLTAETPPGDIGGVSGGRHGIAYTTTTFPDEADPSIVWSSSLKLLKRDGSTRTVADLLAYETEKNPDAGNSYGFQDLDADCAAQVPAEIGGEPYGGIVDAHPYALARAPFGGWYVADAGANAILWVSKWGHIKTVYVAEPQPHVVTAEQAGALGLPECTAGATYNFEPVPTDVEVTKSGHLIVSLLPGGPEGPELGARGSVIRVNPWNGHDKTLATGIAGATNVAVGKHGQVYVTQLFGGQLSVIKHGRLKLVAELTEPAAVEYVRGRLVVSTNVFTDGQIVVVKP